MSGGKQGICLIISKGFKGSQVYHVIIGVMILLVVNGIFFEG